MAAPWPCLACVEARRCNKLPYRSSYGSTAGGRHMANSAKQFINLVRLFTKYFVSNLNILLDHNLVNLYSKIHWKHLPMPNACLALQSLHTLILKAFVFVSLLFWPTSTTTTKIIIKILFSDRESL